MVKQGFRVMDSDMHVIEPSDIFDRYMDRAYQASAPKIARAIGKRGGTFQFEGHILPTVDVDNPERMYGMSRRTDAATAAMRAVGYDGPSQLIAMDMEGIDIAVLFPTVCLYVPNGLDGVDGGLSAGVSRIQ